MFFDCRPLVLRPFEDSVSVSALFFLFLAVLIFFGLGLRVPSGPRRFCLRHGLKSGRTVLTSPETQKTDQRKSEENRLRLLQARQTPKRGHKLLFIARPSNCGTHGRRDHETSRVVPTVVVSSIGSLPTTPLLLPIELEFHECTRSDRVHQELNLLVLSS